ncbi:MAG: aspartyl protease family protein, partial [Actinobacteria bacterium]|nr:aspartyl protease family protein [Actinomycetota bacterium]
MTQAWYFELYETNDLPNSLAAWKTLIWDHCSIPAMEREYAITLSSFKQGVNTAYLTFHTRYTTLMRQAGVKDSAQQANHFIQALNQQDFGLLTADPFFRLEEETGITIKRTHDTMMKLLSYRKRNEEKAKHNHPKPTAGKTTANYVSTSHQPAEPQLHQQEWASKRQEFQDLPTEERHALRGHCHICHARGCHSDRHLKPSSTKASQVKKTTNKTKPLAKVDDTTSEESDGYVNFFDAESNSLTCVGKTSRPTVVNSNSNKLTYSSSTQTVASSSSFATIFGPSVSVSKATQPIGEGNLSQQITLFVKSMGKRPKPQTILKAIDRAPFKSALQFTTIATTTGPTGKSIEVTTTADTGAGINCISPELVAKLQLVEEAMDDPEEVQFANQATLVLDKFVRLNIQIGRAYSKEVLLAVCPIGNQILLGTPWWESIKVVELTSRAKKFSFKSEAFPGSNFFHPKIYSFPFASAGDLLSFGKKQPRPTIRQVTSKMINRMARNHNNLIFQVDLKAVLEGESQPVQKVQTEEDYIVEWFKNDTTPSDIKRMVEEFKDRFQPPTTLPPDRPEDMEINLLPGSTAPKVQGLRRMNEHELKQLQTTLKTLLTRKQIRPSTSEFASQILFVKKPDGSLRL